MAHSMRRPISIEITIIVRALLASLLAIAAGVTIKENIRSTPTTCTEIETATAPKGMKMVPRRSRGIPFASATSSCVRFQKILCGACLIKKKSETYDNEPFQNVLIR